jgi:hypothetical protein
LTSLTSLQYETRTAKETAKDLQATVQRTSKMVEELKASLNHFENPEGKGTLKDAITNTRVKMGFIKPQASNSKKL